MLFWRWKFHIVNREEEALLFAYSTGCHSVCKIRNPFYVENAYLYVYPSSLPLSQPFFNYFCVPIQVYICLPLCFSIHSFVHKLLRTAIHLYLTGFKTVFSTSTYTYLHSFFRQHVFRLQEVSSLTRSYDLVYILYMILSPYVLRLFVIWILRPYFPAVFIFFCAFFVRRRYLFVLCL